MTWWDFSLSSIYWLWSLKGSVGASVNEHLFYGDHKWGALSNPCTCHKMQSQGNDNNGQQDENFSLKNIFGMNQWLFYRNLNQIPDTTFWSYRSYFWPFSQKLFGDNAPGFDKEPYIWLWPAHFSINWSSCTLHHCFPFEWVPHHLRQRCTTFFGKGGRCVLVLVHSRFEDKIMIWTFESQVSKIKRKIYLISFSVAYGLILLSSELLIQWSLYSFIKSPSLTRSFLYYLSCCKCRI